MIEALLIYTIVGIEEEELTSVRGKKYILEKKCSFLVRPLVKEQVEVAGTTYQISEIIHGVREKWLGQERQLPLRVDVGHRGFTYQKGEDPDETMPSDFKKKIVTMLSDGWGIYDENGNVMMWENE